MDLWLRHPRTRVVPNLGRRTRGHTQTHPTGLSSSLLWHFCMPNHISMNTCQLLLLFGWTFPTKKLLVHLPILEIEQTILQNPPLSKLDFGKSFAFLVGRVAYKKGREKLKLQWPFLWLLGVHRLDERACHRSHWLKKISSRQFRWILHSEMMDPMALWYSYPTWMADV